MLRAVRFLCFRAWIPAFSAIFLQWSDAQGATFTVINANNAGTGSLRVAISNANFFAGSDLIDFNIPGTGPFIVNLTTALPPLTEPAIIDATTQPGYSGLPKIELNGASAGTNATGIYLQTSDCVVKGLAINRFTREGICIEGTGSNTIQANFIGTGPYGTNALGNGNGSNGFGGISIYSANNLIGGVDAASRNIISGSNFHGVFLLYGSANGNQILGNYIGVDVTGTKRLGNRKNGISGLGVSNSIIGGTNGSARNIVSGNYENGIYLFSNIPFAVNSVSNLIQGNFIGTDVTGTAAISNNAEGILLDGALYTTIGGTNTGAGNLISGNGGRGIAINANGGTGSVIQGNFIGTDANGIARLGNGQTGVDVFNSSNNIVGGVTVAARNVISANGLSGVSLSDTRCSGNVIQGNYLGTDVTGTNALGNSRNGVFVAGVTNNLIGGTNSGSGNLISGNLQNGVQLADVGCRNNLVQGNLIGTDITGTRRLGNGTSGVRIEAPWNLIGGATVSARNIISGNTNTGVYLLGAVASNNVICGNYIGTSINGLAVISNSYTGLNLENAPRNTIGGTNNGARNVIAGNNLNGIYVQGLSSSNNTVQGNFIGTDATGTIALGNGNGLPIADGAGGIDILGSPANLVGGTNVGAGNLISGNLRDAICIGNPGASNNTVQGNIVGTAADGVSPLGNEWNGVEIRSSGGGGNTRIGGPESGAGNILAYATLGQRNGVRVKTGPGNYGILIRGNSIFFNGGSSANGLGIDTGNFGLNTNDVCDTDDGANGLQNSPVLTNAQSAGGITIVRGALLSGANTTYLLQFYANPIPEPSGNIEGKTYLGDAYVTTGANCTDGVAFTATLPSAVPAGQLVTATATDPTNNTSEFSAAVTVSAGQPPTISVQPQSQAAPYGSNVTFSVTASGTSPLSYQWLFQGTNLAGATTSSLFLPNVQLANAGNYHVTITNIFGSTNSATANLSVLVSSPTLTVQSGGAGQVLISWPTNGPSFALQETTNLAPPIVWIGTTNVPVVTNSQFQVAITATSGNRFYRLTLQ